LVISEDVELAVALRERLARAYVTVCHVRTAEAQRATRDCRPWPWMVIGDRADLPEMVVRTLAGAPTLVLWRGGRSAGLPAHARHLDLFSELATAAADAIGAEVGGVRLAPGGGLTMPGGEHVTSPALEALVASHPRPLFAAPRHFRTVGAILESHRVPLSLERTAAGGILLDARAA
jgi:hypothetical protein